MGTLRQEIGNARAAVNRAAGLPGEQAAAKYSSVNEPRSSNGSLRHQHREVTDRRTRFTLGDNLAMTQALETLVFSMVCAEIAPAPGVLT